MANTYYSYENKLDNIGSAQIIELTSLPTGIQLEVINPDDYQKASITLSEQEQDDLIAGILERRGAIVTINGKSDTGTLLMIARKMKPEISSDGQEQSKLHPTNK